MQDYHPNYAALYDQVTAHRDYGRDAECLMRWFGDSDPTRVLDFGCGTASHFFALREKGFEGAWSGVEPSEGMVAEAKKKGAKNIALSPDGLEGPFSHIYSLYNVLNCIPAATLSDSVKELSALLGEGGEFLFEVWNYDSVIQSPPEKVQRDFPFREGAKTKTVSRLCPPNLELLPEKQMSLRYEFLDGEEVLLTSDHHLFLHSVSELQRVFDASFGKLTFVKSLDERDVITPSESDRFLFGIATK